MKRAHVIAGVVLLGLIVGVGRAEKAPAATTAPAATQPAKKAPPKPPELMTGALDPFDAVKERARFFTTAGKDNELTKDEFAAGRGKAGSFVRKFETFEGMLAFDRDGNKTLDWFEAEAYRRNLRQRLLATYDANKDGKLAGAERDQANRALAAGRLPRAKAAARGRGFWELDPEAIKQHDADGDGQLSRDERRAMWQARASERRAEMLRKYDADKDGTLGDEERKAAFDEMRDRWRLRRFDRNDDGKLDEAESAAAQEADTRSEQRRREFAQMRDDMTKKHDANGDGKLTGEERQAAWADMRDRWATRAYDDNGDGKLDERELAARKAGEAQMKATHDRWRSDWVRRHDADGDGELSDAEREAGHEAVRKEMRELAASWRGQWDTDGDGELSDDERQVMRDSVRERAAEIRKEIDADGDGRTSPQEMRAFFEKLRDVYDTDEDGVLSPDEARAMIRDQMKRFRPPAPRGRDR